MARKVLLHIPIALVGGLLYMGVELLWRGRTHWSMGLLGGVCFALIGTLDEGQRQTPILVQMLVGALIVTVAELVTGLIVNVWLGWAVWDYSDMPGNLLGQICPQFTAVWVALSFVAIKVENATHKLFRRIKSYEKR